MNTSWAALELLLKCVRAKMLSNILTCIVLWQMNSEPEGLRFKGIVLGDN